MTAPQPQSPPPVICDWAGLGLADWDEVINAFARPEPCRPGVTRDLTSAQRGALVSAALGLPENGQIVLKNHAGLGIRLRGSQLIPKLARAANHAAYAGWIRETLRYPLEV